METNFNQSGLKKERNSHSIKKHIFTNFDLKMIAAFSMLLDHFAVFFVHSKYLYYFLRGIGRISFPIYAFLLVEGFFHTSDRKKYLGRIAIFALISEIPYDLAFQHRVIELQHQNIFVTLLIGLLAVWGLHSVSTGSINYPKKLMAVFGVVELQNIVRLFIMLSACGAAYFVHATYEYAGVFLIMCFYIFHEKPVGMFMVNAFFNVFMYGGVQSFGICSAVPIAMYNGKSGNKKWKWFFYVFYPAHLLFFVLIRMIR